MSNNCFSFEELYSEQLKRKELNQKMDKTQIETKLSLKAQQMLVESPTNEV